MPETTPNAERRECTNDGCSAPATVCRGCVRDLALMTFGGISRDPYDRDCVVCEAGPALYCDAHVVAAVLEQRDALRDRGERIHLAAARAVYEPDLSDEAMRALAARVWEDPPDAFDDSDFDVLRDALRDALRKATNLDGGRDA